MAFWVTFAAPITLYPTVAPMRTLVASVSGMTEQEIRAYAAAEKLPPITRIETLPYPASPQWLNKDGARAFCRHGSKCAGTASCRAEFACND